MKTITLTAPEGYEFTGEFRFPKDGEYVLLMEAGPGEGGAYKSRGHLGECRYILKKIEPKLRLSDIEFGEKFHMVQNTSRKAEDACTRLQHYKYDPSYNLKAFIFCGGKDSGYTLYHRDDNPEVVRA